MSRDRRSMKTARNVALLLVCAILGLGVASPIVHSAPPCWAKHRSCPTSTASTTTTASATTTSSTTTTTAAGYLFDDEFDGAAGAPPDPSKWWPTPWCSSSSEDQLGCFNPANAYLDGQGHLVLRISAGTMGRTYDFARIQTFQEGGWPPPVVLWSHEPPIQIDARIKMAAGAGIWEGPWADGVNVTGSSVLELDYGEVRGAQPTVYNCNIHGPVSGGAAIDTGSDLTAGFHDYWVDYYPDHAVFGIDALACGSFTTPAEQEGVRLADIVGPPGTWGGLNGPPPASAIPADMLVDYVRVTTIG